jgi:hypothetical protein
MGVSLMHRERPEEALAHFERFDKNPQALEFMGHCYRLLKRPRAAQDCFARADTLRAGAR